MLDHKPFDSYTPGSGPLTPAGEKLGRICGRYANFRYFFAISTDRAVRSRQGQFMNVAQQVMNQCELETRRALRASR